jgi:hypothetical protein
MVKPFFGSLAAWGFLDRASRLLLALPLVERERLAKLLAGSERTANEN